MKLQIQHKYLISHETRNDTKMMLQNILLFFFTSHFNILRHSSLINFTFLHSGRNVSYLLKFNTLTLSRPKEILTPIILLVNSLYIS